MKLIVKTFQGLEKSLEKELASLGAKNISSGRRNVTCETTLEGMYRICLWSRLGLRVLVPILEFDAKNEKEIYDGVFAYNWHELISPDKTFLIDHVSFSQVFPNSQYLAHKSKDAIVDQIRSKMGSRPSVSIDSPDIIVNLHVADTHFTISIDATGQSLNKRGYRSQQLPSTTNEVLASGLVELSGWTVDEALIDPMCGCGTICIEAAMKAMNIAPGLRRSKFSFMNWLTYDDVIWKKLTDEAKSSVKQVRMNIIGSDVDVEALDIAKQSTLDLGISRDVRIMRCSLREQSSTTQTGVVITCPPVVFEDSQRDIHNFYKEMAYLFLRRYPEHDAWVYSSNQKALRGMDLLPEQKLIVYNGPTEGYFNKYPV